MHHIVDLTGDYRSTIYSAARKLLANGAADTDTLEIRRNGKPSMSGIVGECAKWTVMETERGLRLVRWRPFPEQAVRPPDAIEPFLGS